MSLVAVVLAGGRSSRMQRDKAGLRIDGTALLRRAVQACLDAGCERVAVAAPDQSIAAHLEPDERVLPALEDPPFGGPSAGIAAGVAALAPQPDDRVLVLACDLPHAGRLVPLLAAAPQPGAVVPVDEEGYPQYLAARYPAHVLVEAVLAQPGVRDLAVKRLFAPVSFERLDVDVALLADVDDPEQARAAGVELGDEEA